MCIRDSNLYTNNGSNNNVSIFGNHYVIVINGHNNNIQVTGDSNNIVLNGSNNDVKFNGQNNTCTKNGSNNNVTNSERRKKHRKKSKATTSAAAAEENSNQSRFNDRLIILERLMSLLTSTRLILTNDEKFAIVLNIDSILTKEIRNINSGNVDDIARGLGLITSFANNNHMILICEILEEALLTQNKVIIKCCCKIIHGISILCYTEESVCNAPWVYESADIRIPNILTLHQQSINWLPFDEQYINDVDINVCMEMLKFVTNDDLD